MERSINQGGEMTNRIISEDEEALLTPDDVATLFRQSRSFVFKAWRKWMKYGVRPIRINNSKKGRLLFRRSDIERLLDKWSLEPKYKRRIKKENKNG